MQLAVLVSGGGSNFQAILDAIESERLPATVALCISSRPDAGALDRARRHGVPVATLDRSLFGDESSLATSLSGLLSAHGVDFIALAGFMRRIPSAVVGEFRNRILNVHPALLPAFGGPGMFGRRVHEAVLQHGARFSGATVHLVDEEYDTGPIVMQDVVPVLQEDTPDDLARRVLAVEHRLYPEALRLFALGLVRVEGRRVWISTEPSQSGAKS